MIGVRTLTLAVTLAMPALVVGMLPARGEPPRHLVPFPEDAADNPAAEVKPARPQPPKADFRPRFKVPAVRQAEHREPTAESPAPQAQPSADRVARAPQAADDARANPADPMAGRGALDEAYAKSKTADSKKDYTEVIELCQQAAEAGLSEKYEEYANRLKGWAYNRRGEALAKEGKDADALADFEAAVVSGGAWRAIHNRGVSYAAAGRLDEAMADFDRTIKINPRYAHAYFNRGELRYRQGDYPAAIEDYTLALKLGWPDPAVYISRGHAFYRVKRFGDALRDYGEAIRLDPENAAALVNRGDTYSDVGQYGEAAKDYRAAVRVAPKNARAFQAAAWLMATCPDVHYRDKKLAIDAAQRAIELGGATYRHLSTLAAAQASAELFEEAQQTQEQAIASAPKQEVVTAEKLMSLYQRQIAFRDRPLTAFKTPEEMDESDVRPAAAFEPAGPQEAAPPGRQTWYQVPPGQPLPAPQPGGAMQAPRRLPPPSEMPREIPPQQAPPQKARLFSPRSWK
jgi:tetratricopeptide (TPR) repeat protein